MNEAKTTTNPGGDALHRLKANLGSVIRGKENFGVCPLRR